jgi:hypothetical protein
MGPQPTTAVPAAGEVLPDVGGGEADGVTVIPDTATTEPSRG